jgi:hypothetical protein
MVTGDNVYPTEDGRLILTVSAKDLIVRSGHNIDPAAIEDVANAFPGVQINSAVGMPDQYAGEVPILFVVAAPGQTIDLSSLEQHLERNVMEPPAKPRRVVVLDRLPVTAVGKIFKPALRYLAIEEKARLEIGRLFGKDAAADIEVGKDEKLIPASRSSSTAARHRGFPSLPMFSRPCPSPIWSRAGRRGTGRTRVSPRREPHSARSRASTSRLTALLWADAGVRSRVGRIHRCASRRHSA